MQEPERANLHNYDATHEEQWLMGINDMPLRDHLDGMLDLMTKHDNDANEVIADLEENDQIKFTLKQKQILFLQLNWSIQDFDELDVPDE